jgi:hypothetical protein
MFAPSGLHIGGRTLAREATRADIHGSNVRMDYANIYVRQPNCGIRKYFW